MGRQLRRHCGGRGAERCTGGRLQELAAAQVQRFRCDVREAEIGRASDQHAVIIERLGPLQPRLSTAAHVVVWGPGGGNRTRPFSPNHLARRA